MSLPSLYMKQEPQILFRGEKYALTKTQVESFPVKAYKKLSEKKIVGDFSIIPTIPIDQIGLIGRAQLSGIRLPSGTKSARKGWRVIAKW